MSRTFIHSVVFSSSVMCSISSFIPDDLTDKRRCWKQRASAFRTSPVASFSPLHITFIVNICLPLRVWKDVMTWRGVDDYFPLAVSHFASTLRAGRCHPSKSSRACLGLLPWFICLNHAGEQRASRDSQRLHSHHQARKTSSLPPDVPSPSSSVSLFPSFLQDTEPLFTVSSC